MDLKEYYLQNIKESDYHYRFYNDIKKINVKEVFWCEIEDYKFEVFDSEEAIGKFKGLCQPDINLEGENKIWFYLITYYLYSLGYVIKEFPRVLARPPEKPYDFVYTEIRNRIIEIGEDDNGIVRYSTRRVFVARLTFEQKTCNIEVGKSLNQKFIAISTRQASFENMQVDEKIAAIVNLIENLLKKEGKFITPEYASICCGFLDDTTVKNYRHKLQCFRHCTEQELAARKSFSPEQKEFLIDYGITMVKAIHALLK